MKKREHLKSNEKVKKKFKKKIIATLKSQNNNESLDYYLTQYDRKLNALWDGAQLEVHFSSKL